MCDLSSNARTARDPTTQMLNATKSRGMKVNSSTGGQPTKQTVSVRELLMMLFLPLLFPVITATSSLLCPITNETNIIYSIVKGVGPASRIWVEDFLWWWKQTDPTINYLSINSNDFQVCNFSIYPNLRVYINPGGNTYDQLTAMGSVGTESIKQFILRDQKNPSSYIGFCAGGYLASHDYLWETLYEGPGYFNFEESPPLSLFPHMVEGSIVDINDEQFGDQFNSKFRLVNVSNGHQMLYYGGSTFGWNGALDPTDSSSPVYDPEIEILLYYTDFYGYHSMNIPAAWRYQHNILLTSVHPEADNCTSIEDSDCPPSGTIPLQNILQNRAWLCSYINELSSSNFIIPSVPLPPSFQILKPHVSYPKELCYDTSTASIKGSQILFCEDFDSNESEIPTGLAPQFQRNQTDFNIVRPWNTSYTDTWNSGVTYASPSPGAGDGYAVCVPMAPVSHLSSITTRPFDITHCPSTSGSHNKLFLEFLTTGRAVSTGYLSVDIGAGNDSQQYHDWVPVMTYFYAKEEEVAGAKWKQMVREVDLGEFPSSSSPLRFVRFTCAAGNAVENFCALDSLFVSC
jgi:glutamine amidotransferase-like uncharacterized protein